MVTRRLTGRGSCVAVLLIAAAPAAMLRGVWISPTSAEEDDLAYFYPTRKMVGEALSQGRWPLDNPREATGAVFLADPQAAVMYPPTWLFAWLQAKTAYRVGIFLAFAVMGLGAYAYLRRLDLAVAPATFGALAMTFCGFMVGHRVHLAVIQTAAMLPWGLWCVEGLRKRPGAWAAGDRPRRTAVAAWLVLVAVGYLAVTAGHWPTLIHMSMVWFAYLCLRGRPFFRSLAAGAGAGALAGALAAPQLCLAGQLLAGTTRQGIGYATAGENSFYPLSAVHALLPMLMGTRTPNFYPQRWWGAWHLCEMLGYVGLATLALAGVAVWRLYRKPKAPRTQDPQAPSPARDLLPGHGERYRPLVRIWTWIMLGAGVWMLGYYLPTYRLIHRLPVLGVVRCPARMVLAADMALATLAAILIHVVMRSRGGAGARVRPDEHRGGAPERMARTTRRAVTLVLPGLMAMTLLLVAAGAWFVRWQWPGGIGGLGFIVGGPAEALEALRPTNPALWVPLATAAVTIVVVRFWLARPARRAPALVALLIADLFFVAGFVDTPGARVVPQDPDSSPAAAWLARHAPQTDTYRLWGLSGAGGSGGLEGSYHDRAAELLLPRTAQGMGFSTINGYGPVHSPGHAHLLGFQIFGTARDWADLMRRNDLLSLYGVRYVITSEPGNRAVLESVRVPPPDSLPDGPELITGDWDLQNAQRGDGCMRFRTPFLWRFSQARHAVKYEPDQVYRIRLEVRGPEAGAANYLQAEYYEKTPDRNFADERMRLIVYPEQTGPDWRQFEWHFRTPKTFFGQTFSRILTTSERPVEVRNVSVRRSHWPTPRDLEGRLTPGQAVYEKRAEFPALNAGDPPVAVYENLLWSKVGGPTVPGTPAAIETFKRDLSAWRRPGDPLPPRPNVALTVAADPGTVFRQITLPAAALYAAACLAALGLVLRSALRSP